MSGVSYRTFTGTAALPGATEATEWCRQIIKLYDPRILVDRLVWEREDARAEVTGAARPLLPPPGLS